MENSRGEFGSTFGFIMAAVGSAVGLGNIWGFPFKMGANGGFAFLIVYLVLAVFVGLCVMLAELAIGRKTNQSPIGAYRALCKKYAFIGSLSVVAAFIVLCFYNLLGGMVLRYSVGYLLAMVGVNTFGDPTAFFGNFIYNGGSMVLYFLVYITINVVIISAGVSGGIEKFNRYAMPALFVLLLVVLIYVACQPGAAAGYQYMFGFNLEPLKENWLGVTKVAAGQMFFSLSLGMGIMITYGSYLAKSEKLQRNTVIIVICDTLIALMAGMIVMPACSAFGLEFSGGPGLLFSSMQLVFTSMGGFIGNLMGFMFYTLVLLAAISSSISVLEAVVSTIIDNRTEKKKPAKRRVITIVLALFVLICGLPCTLDALGSGDATLPAPYELLNLGADSIKGWNDCWLDFYDMFAEGFFMPLGSLICCLFVGWKMKLDLVKNECESTQGAKFWGAKFFNLCYKFIAPIGLIIVLYGTVVDYLL